ncbi:hypothetical protein CLOSTMETH_01061 [[Clostridium] methylpentosum DSM 5476]|uniref:Uncharacterized protein n=1 Tax=[Clostridium] methylpentosum DSM 5476 TaxID=537013 RepID=C0EB43_9FIRM|nr:hypothetical protein CLOSTMETH_01061 [[Clostridium] methylpentosum DSM 5476]
MIGYRADSYKVFKNFFIVSPSLILYYKSIYSDNISFKSDYVKQNISLFISIIKSKSLLCPLIRVQ